VSEHMRLPRARAAEDEQRTVAMGDGRVLRAIKAVQRSGHPC
jgi:hypothetical protein